MQAIKAFLLGTIALAPAALSGCGGDDQKSAEKQSAPPPIVGGGADAPAFSLAGGTYYVSDVHDLQDGCGKHPLDSGSPLTEVPFVLTNDGGGNIALDMCTFNERSLAGAVHGNAGTLYVMHPNRVVGTGATAASFDQECIADVTVKADDTLAARYTENQRNRNEVMKEATVNLDECTTSFTFTLKRRS